MKLWATLTGKYFETTHEVLYNMPENGTEIVAVKDHPKFVVKINDIENMQQDLVFLLSAANIPEKLFPYGGVFAIEKNKCGILMYKFDYSLDNLPKDLFQIFWKTVMIQCINQLRLIHTSIIERCYGFVHGDIKTSNILVNKDGNTTICDFGLSTVVETAINIKPLADNIDYFVKYAGASPTENWGPKTDLIALGNVIKRTATHHNLSQKDVSLRKYYYVLEPVRWDTPVPPEIYDALITAITC